MSWVNLVAVQIALLEPSMCVMKGLNPLLKAIEKQRTVKPKSADCSKKFLPFAIRNFAWSVLNECNLNFICSFNRMQLLDF